MSFTGQLKLGYDKFELICDTYYTAKLPISFAKKDFSFASITK